MYEQAVAQFRLALSDEPGDAVTHFNLANVLAVQSKPDEAIKEYTETLRLAPDHAGAHEALGEVLAGLGRLDEAVRHYNESLKVYRTDRTPTSTWGLRWCVWERRMRR